VLGYRHRSRPTRSAVSVQTMAMARIAEENPDLPFSVIRDILVADQDVAVGEYQFG